MVKILERMNKDNEFSNTQAYQIWKLIDNNSQQQSDQTARNIFNALIYYASNLDQCSSILTYDNIQQIMNSINVSKRDCIIEFFCQFGCAIVFRKQHIWNKLVIDVVFPTAWNLGSTILKTDGAYKMFPCSPANFQYLSVGKISILDKSAQRICDDFMNMLQQQKKYSLKYQEQKNKKKNHHTPSWYYQLLLKVFRKLQQFYQNNKDQQFKEKAEQKITNIEEFCVLSKGGTLDVGLHTGITKPTTSIPVAFALIQYFLGKECDEDQQIFQVFYVSFELYLLTKISKQYPSQNYIQKIRQLIWKVKKINKNGIQFNKYILTQMVKQIIQNIKQNKQYTSFSKKQMEKDYQKLQKEIQNKDWKLANMQLVPISNKIIQQHSVNDLKIKLGCIDKINFVFKRPLPLLYQLPKNIKYSQYVIIVQITLFRLMKQFSKSGRMPVTMQDINNPAFITLLKNYEQRIKNPSLQKYYMGSQNQAASLIHLVKLIFCIIAFEVVKQNRRHMNSNLQGYRVPYNDEDLLFKHFSSLSYDARQAAQLVFSYFKKRKNKQKIFVLQPSSDSFIKFALKCYEQSDMMKKWLAGKIKQLQKRKQNLGNSLKIFHTQLEDCQEQLNILINQLCSCTEQRVYKNGKYKFITNKCKTCKKKQQKKSEIKRLQNLQQNYINSQIPQTNLGQQIYAFLANIPKQIQTMIKVFYMLYGVRQNSTNNLYKEQNAVKNISYGDLTPYAASKKIAKFKKCNVMAAQAYKLVIYPGQNAFLCFKYSTSPNYFMQKDYYVNNNNQTIVWAASDPCKYEFQIPLSKDSQKRQHQIYSKMDQATAFKLKPQQFVNLCSIRVSMRTQIAMLCDLLLSRKVTLDILKQNSFELGWEILIRTVSSLIAHKFVQNQLDFSIKKQHKIVTDSIIQFLQNYHKRWNYTQINSLIMVGPFMSLFCKYMNYNGEGGSLKLLKCAYNQFIKLNNDLKNDSNKTIQIKSRQAFIAFSGLCCVTQSMLNLKNKQQIQIFVFFIILKHSCTVFINQNLKYHETYSIIKKFSFLNDISIYMNIQTVLEYLKKYPYVLNNIVKQIDQNCTQNTQWQFSPQIGPYIFRGISRIGSSIQQYLANIQTGILLKNGKQITGLSQSIKQNKYFKQIFGSRDFQVFHKDNYSRTKRGFKQLLAESKNKEDNIFFQFKQISNNKIQIKMIQRRVQNQRVVQESYILIQRQTILKFQILIPPLYFQGCLAWYSEKKSCLIFRKPTLEKMKLIQIIIFLQKDNLVVKKAILLPNQSKQKTLFQISKNIDFYDQIVFKPKKYQYKKSLSYKILLQIQLPQYIIELKKDGIIKFWLHRYDLVFRREKEQFIPEGYSDYSVNQKYHSVYQCPWDNTSKIKAICLLKIRQNALNSMQHNLKIMIPNICVTQSGQINLPEGYNIKLNVFFYDIHEHFKDIRGRTSQANLLLASLLISCNEYLKNRCIGLTANEYCLSLMRSCYNTRPLTLSQFQKIQSIMYHACSNKNSSILLSCQVLLECSQSLNSLYYTDEQQNINKPHIISKEKHKLQNYSYQLLKKYNTKFSLARKKYFENIHYLSSFERLNNLEKSILRITDEKVENSRILKKWSISYPLKININQLRLSQVQKNYTQNLFELNQFYKQIFQNNKETNYNNECQSQIKQNEKVDKVYRIFTMKYQNNQSVILKEMIQQQKQSYYNHLIIVQQNKEIQKVKAKLNKLQERRAKIFNILKLNRQKIEDLIKDLELSAANHIDVMTELIPTLTSVHFSKVLFEGLQYLKHFYPDSSDQQLSRLYKICQIWVNLVIELDSLKRLSYLLQSGQDLRGIKREIMSPRQQITKFNPWICFQAQMRIKIWASQFKTYKDLINGQNRSYSQLNMGQGKTQVIIPMFVLQKLYCLDPQKRRIPRINLLSSLIDQSRLNYFRFFSSTSFRVPCLEIPFNRTVCLSQQNLRAIKNGLYSFLSKCIVVCDRESSLSMTLKIRELNEIAYDQQITISPFLTQQKQKWLFGQKLVFDIFDEVDALVTPKKSFVYAIGGSQQLPQANIRIQLCRYFLQIFVKQMLEFCLKEQIIAGQSQTQLLNAKEQGYYPIIRYLCAKNYEKSIKFRTKIINIFLSEKYLLDNFSFYKNLNQNQANILINYFIYESQNQFQIQKINLPYLVLPQIYAVRGIIAFGILEHCLSLRCGVEYGIPNKEHPKRLGIPYEAADVPSKRSEYAHPDVAIILSYISRYISGLTYNQFQQSIMRLLKLTQSSQKENYKKWLNELNPQKRKQLNLQDVTKINFKSMSIVNQMFECFKKCRPTIAFWLNHVIFPSELRQYTQSITSSSWDLANAKQSIGFSGTKDSRCVFPAQLNWVPSQDPEIRGTDGKNISLLLSQTKSVLQITQLQQIHNLKWLWQKLIIKALNQNISCVIDAGAILVGRSIQNQIAPWIGERLIEMKSSLKGITYPNQKGQWKVYDFHSKTYIQRNTRIPQHETFVIFDEARTRGSDIKMAYTACAALTLGPNMTQLKLMQAMGRLRNLQVGQTIKIFATSQILQKIQNFNLEDPVQKQIKSIFCWVIYNSVHDNQKFLYHNNKLGWLHFQSLNRGMRPYIQQFTPQLDLMYKRNLYEDSPYNLNEKQIKNLRSIDYAILSNPIAQKQFSIMQKYGNNFKIKCQGFDDVCERQVQLVQQVQEQKQIIGTSVTPIFQIEQYVRTNSTNISTLPYNFSNKFLTSFNFRNCTKNKKSVKYSNNILNPFGLIFQQTVLKLQSNILKDQNKYNELMYANFIEISETGLCLITQRQANKMLKKGVRFLYPKNQSLIQNQKYIVHISDLTIDCKILKQRNLQKQYVQILFFNGNENFSKNKLEQKSEELSEYQILLKSLRTVRQQKQVDWQQKLEELSSHFLMRRRIFMDKYHESSLQKIYINLKNDKV